MSKVYSFLRFSSAEQAQETNAVWQSEYAARWATEDGMTFAKRPSVRCASYSNLQTTKKP